MTADEPKMIYLTARNVMHATLHDEVVVLRAEVERQQAEIRELNEEIRRLDKSEHVESAGWSFAEHLSDKLEYANDQIERQLADLETLRAAHDGTSVDWRTR